MAHNNFVAGFHVCRVRKGSGSSVTSPLEFFVTREGEWEWKLTKGLLDGAAQAFEFFESETAALAALEKCRRGRVVSFNKDSKRWVVTHTPTGKVLGDYHTYEYALWWWGDALPDDSAKQALAAQSVSA